MTKIAAKPRLIRELCDAERAALAQTVLTPGAFERLSPEASARLFYELQLHQIELEQQNEELRRAEQALEASRALYLDLWDRAPVGYCTLSKKGVVTRLNHTLAAFLGVAPNVAAGMPPFFRFIAKEDQGVFHAMCARLRQLHETLGGQTGPSQSCELRMVRSDGTQLWAQLEAKLDQGACGNACAHVPSARDLGMYVTVADIHARKEKEAILERERNLRARSEALERLFEFSPDGILVASINGQISMANRQATRLLGYEREQLQGMRVDELLPIAKRLTHDVLREGVPGSIFPLAMGGSGEELLAVRRSGETIAVDISVNLFDGEDGTEAIVAIRDISERLRAERQRVELERQLFQSQKMDAVGTLASGIAHDFNNMLAIIAGSVRLAQRKIPLDHPIASNLGDIQEASNRAANLVQQMLTFARRKPTPAQRVFLPSIVSQTLSLLQNAIPTSIDLQSQLEDEVPRVLGDAAELQRVLVNLCTNAWHAYEGRAGTIRVELSSVHLEGQEAGLGLAPGRYACIAVIDRAKGMDEATSARIFEPFFTTKDTGQGNGLGLAVVHGIVRNHGGAVRVESKPGRGATVRVYLPESPHAVPSDTPMPLGRSPLPCPGSRVLFIDDEPMLGTIVGGALSAMGHQVTTFVDAPLALEALEREPLAFDIVLTDLHMPRTSGLDVLARVAALRPSLPVIVLSGDLSDGATKNLLAAGARGVVRKPCSDEELEQALASVLNRCTRAP